MGKNWESLPHPQPPLSPKGTGQEEQVVMEGEHLPAWRWGPEVQGSPQIPSEQSRAQSKNVRIHQLGCNWADGTGTRQVGGQGNEHRWEENSLWEQMPAERRSPKMPVGVETVILLLSVYVKSLKLFKWFQLASLYIYERESESHWAVSDSLWRYGLYSPLGSSVHEILQARILECVGMPSTRGSSWLRDRTQVSCSGGRFFTIWATMCHYIYKYTLKK